MEGTPGARANAGAVNPVADGGAVAAADAGATDDGGTCTGGCWLSWGLRRAP